MQSSAGNKVDIRSTQAAEVENRRQWPRQGRTGARRTMRKLAGSHSISRLGGASLVPARRLFRYRRISDAPKGMWSHLPSGGDQSLRMWPHLAPNVSATIDECVTPPSTGKTVAPQMWSHLASPAPVSQGYG